MLFFSYRVREESPQLGVSRPTLEVHKEARSKGGKQHTNPQQNAHTHGQESSSKTISQFLTRTELESLRITNGCAKTECG